MPVFWEEFRTLDRSIWAAEIGDGSDHNIPGWGNNELQCYTDAPDNVAVVPNPDSPGDGLLRIRSVFSGQQPKPCASRISPAVPKAWTSARLTTRGSKTFTPAATGCGPLRIEARIKMPGKMGHWAGFWALGAQGTWPAAGEIDIAEHANTASLYYATTHSANLAGAWQQHPPAGREQVPVANPAAWNVYRVDWSCDSIAWFLNGEEKQRLNKAQVSNWPATFTRPFYLIFNLAVGGNLPGNNVDPAGGEMLVDWVRVTAPPAAAAASG